MMEEYEDIKHNAPDAYNATAATAWGQRRWIAPNHANCEAWAFLLQVAEILSFFNVLCRQGALRLERIARYMESIYIRRNWIGAFRFGSGRARLLMNGSLTSFQITPIRAFRNNGPVSPTWTSCGSVGDRCITIFALSGVMAGSGNADFLRVLVESHLGRGYGDGENKWVR